MKAQLAKEKHDDIVAKAIAKAKEMQPVLAKQKEEEDEKIEMEETKKRAAKKKEDDDLKDFIKGKGTNQDIHSITQKLSSFTDMANSLKDTIDDVDTMK